MPNDTEPEWLFTVQTGTDWLAIDLRVVEAVQYIEVKAVPPPEGAAGRLVLRTSSDVVTLDVVREDAEAVRHLWREVRSRMEALP